MTNLLSENPFPNPPVRGNKSFSGSCSTAYPFSSDSSNISEQPKSSTYRMTNLAQENDHSSKSLLSEHYYLQDTPKSGELLTFKANYSDLSTKQRFDEAAPGTGVVRGSEALDAVSRAVAETSQKFDAGAKTVGFSQQKSPKRFAVLEHPTPVKHPMPDIITASRTETMTRVCRYNSEVFQRAKCEKIKGDAIIPLFSGSEAWAKNDWISAMKHLKASELARLEADYVVRVVRSSNFIAIPEKRLQRNLKMFRDRVRWKLRYGVDKLLGLLDPNCNNSETSSGKAGTVAYSISGAAYDNHSISIDPFRIEQFRNLVLPLRIYGFSKAKNPVIKLSFQESNWKEALKHFKDPKELKTLMILSLEKVFNDVRLLTKSNMTETVHITGKYILICDFEGFNLSALYHAAQLKLYKLPSMIAKYYPETVLKTYVINNKYGAHASKILWPFVPRQIIRRIRFFPDEKALKSILLNVDGFKISQIPVEHGGTSEGRYVLDIRCD